MKPYIKYLQKCLIKKFEDKYINKKEGVKFMIWSIIVGGIIGFIAGEITCGFRKAVATTGTYMHSSATLLP